MNHVLRTDEIVVESRTMFGGKPDTAFQQEHLRPAVKDAGGGVMFAFVKALSV